MSIVTCALCKGSGEVHYVNWKGIRSSCGCSVCSGAGEIDFKGQKMPYAYFIQDEKAWDLEDVKQYYPEIVEYWKSNGIQDVVIKPCGPVDEDCLYLDGNWEGYCRNTYEWKMGKDLTTEEKAPTEDRRENET